MGPAPNELLFIVYRWLAYLPLVLTLIVGIVICRQQQYRRPRLAKWLGWCFGAQLLWVAIVSPIYGLLIAVFAGTSFNPSEVGEIAWIARMFLIRLLPSLVNAVIWGCVLWSILTIDDYQGSPAGESSR